MNDFLHDDDNDVYVQVEEVNDEEIQKMLHMGHFMFYEWMEKLKMNEINNLHF